MLGDVISTCFLIYIFLAWRQFSGSNLKKKGAPLFPKSPSGGLKNPDKIEYEYAPFPRGGRRLCENPPGGITPSGRK